MADLTHRSLEVFADGVGVGQGCHLRLTGCDSLCLRPGFFLLTGWDLSASAAAQLASAGYLEVRSGASILAAGDICDAHTCTLQGRQRTEIGFSPGLRLWESAVSLSAAAGMPVSDTVRAVLAASGMGIALAGFTGKDPVFTRPQAFFGRTVFALEDLASAADADAWLSPAGLIVCGREDRTVTLNLAEGDLLSAPTAARDRMMLTTAMIGWSAGAYVRYTWQGQTGEGRILSRFIDADNVSGPWKAEMILRQV